VTQRRVYGSTTGCTHTDVLMTNIQLACAGLWWAEGEEPLYYLVSPKDVVVGRACEF
jgi:hypothetical protein